MVEHECEAVGRVLAPDRIEALEVFIAESYAVEIVHSGNSLRMTEREALELSALLIFAATTLRERHRAIATLRVGNETPPRAVSGVFHGTGKTGR